MCGLSFKQISCVSKGLKHMPLSKFTSNIITLPPSHYVTSLYKIHKSGLVSIFCTTIHKLHEVCCILKYYSHTYIFFLYFIHSFIKHSSSYHLSRFQTIMAQGATCIAFNLKYNVCTNHNAIQSFHLLIGILDFFILKIYRAFKRLFIKHNTALEDIQL